MDAAYEATIHVFDEVLFRKQAVTSDPEIQAESPMEEVVRAVMVDPAGIPVECGYEIMDVDVSVNQDGFYVVSVQANVIEPDELRQAAAAAYEKVWGEAGWSSETISEALYEHVFGSNEQASTCELGFEVMSVNYDIGIRPTLG